MRKPLNGKNHTHNLSEISLRQLKKELKLLPTDINKQRRFLDLLHAEKNIVRTDVERAVLIDFINTSKSKVDFFEKRLDRYQQCYQQLKEKKSFDKGLLLPDELESLKRKTRTKSPQKTFIGSKNLLTGTDG